MEANRLRERCPPKEESQQFILSVNGCMNLPCIIISIAIQKKKLELNKVLMLAELIQRQFKEMALFDRTQHPTASAFKIGTTIVLGLAKYFSSETVQAEA